MTRFLTVDELVYINEQFPAAEPIHKILRGKDTVRDMDLLAAAAGRPMQTAFGQDAYPTLEAKAAALLHSISRNHPFADGNKRTAAVAAILMLAVNGRCVTWDPREALDRIAAVAEGRIEVEAFAAWLPTESCAPSLEADATHDTHLIAGILAEHAWLLDELAGR
jgi:death-on-curing protein